MALDADQGTSVSMPLACREPFDAAGLLGFLARTGHPRGGAGDRGQLHQDRAHSRRARAIIELIPRPGQGQVLLRARLSPPGADQPARRPGAAGCWTPTPTRLAIDAALTADELLAPLVQARPGLRVPGSYDGFELAVRAVLGQQVSVAAARTFAGRLAAQHGAAPPRPAARPSWPRCFPSPAELADADLSRLGLTTSRQRTLRALAAAAAAGRLSLDPGADPAEIAARLAELPGIGPWTIGYILMRCRRRPGRVPPRPTWACAGPWPGWAPRPGHDARWRPWRSVRRHAPVDLGDRAMPEPILATVLDTPIGPLSLLATATGWIGGGFTGHPAELHTRLHRSLRDFALHRVRPPASCPGWPSRCAGYFARRTARAGRHPGAPAGRAVPAAAVGRVAGGPTGPHGQLHRAGRPGRAARRRRGPRAPPAHST